MARPRQLNSWRSLSSATLVAAGFSALLTAVGCGPKSDRLAVSGTVKLNGAPLDDGSIRFATLGGGKLFASGAMIKDGEYHIPQEKGLPPGTYRVEINAPDTKAPLVADRPAPGQPSSPPTAPERIPPEYNTGSKQSVEVTAAGSNQFTFEIVNHRSK